MFHKPLNWLSTRVLLVWHFLAGGHATLLASGPTFGGEILCFLGAESPIKQGFPVRTPGSATPTVLAARTFTNSGQTAHSPGYGPSQGS
jgi:hypothetical protein